MERIQMAHHHFSEQRKISDILTDRNEFPSLAEVSKQNKVRDSSQCDDTLLSYSDKLKISYHPKQNLSNKFSIGKKTFTEFIPGVPILINTSENKSSQNKFSSSKPEETNSTAPILKEFSQSNHKVETSLNAWSRIVSAPQNPKHLSHTPKENVSTNYKGKNPSLTCKEKPKKNVSPESNAEGEIKKKKRKRKSKIKRQAALKSGKVSLMTPEIHSKIINQTKYSNHSISIGLSTNIHDSEEYPELGKMVNMKKIKPEKRNIHYQNANVAFSEKEQLENNEQLKLSTVNTENSQDLQKIFLNGTKPNEISKEAKNDLKSVVRPYDPITLSFLDILSTSKPKVKEQQEKLDVIVRPVTYKSSSKKINSQPHNLLDSTPVVKRGKEREIPKAKKPSHMKKIILMDRKNRQEQLIHLKNSLNETDKPSLPVPVQENNVASVVNDNNGSSDNESTAVIVSVSPLREETIVTNEQLTINIENNSNEVDYKVKEETRTQENISCIFNSVDELIEDVEQRGVLASPIIHNKTEKLVKAKSSQIADALTLKHIEMLNSMFGFTMSLKDADQNKSSCFSDEERLNASKILIHTRNFREYCNHLPSEEIDDAVSALLADIVRFQDRMHQKDPVKAHIKRRLICGIKEVKKHLKLRKVKCVILATDVENIQTEGGLNDALSDLKQAAADHQIPCIFALRKRKLGKLCHKPVPVSCIGVFNYEGTEVNFKKMMELLNQSKEDYEQILRGVMIKLSDDDIKQLFKARLVAPESLLELRSNILRKTLLENPKIEDMPNIEVAVKS